MLVFGGGWGSQTYKDLGCSERCLDGGVPRRIRIGNVQKDVWMGGSETYKDWECSEMRVTGGVARRVRIGNVQKYVDTFDWRGFSSWGFSLGVPQN